VAISSPVEKQYLYFRRLPIPQTGALAAAESGLRLLTQAAIEKRTLLCRFRFPHVCHSFSFQPADGAPIFDLKEALYAQAMPPNGHA